MLLFFTSDSIFGGRCSAAKVTLFRLFLLPCLRCLKDGGEGALATTKANNVQLQHSPRVCKIPTAPRRPSPRRNASAFAVQLKGRAQLSLKVLKRPKVQKIRALLPWAALAEPRTNTTATYLNSYPENSVEMTQIPAWYLQVSAQIGEGRQKIKPDQIPQCYPEKQTTSCFLCLLTQGTRLR